MNTEIVLSKVYASSALVISAIMLGVCLVLGWTIQMTAYTIMVSLLVCSPALIIVNMFCWLLKKVEMATGFTWMLMLACVPLLVMIPALLFANELPGDEAFLLAIGIMSCYTGILSQGIAISRLFESINETE